MKAFNNIQEIKDTRTTSRCNIIIYKLLGTLLGELDRLDIPRNQEPTADQIYATIKKMHDAVEPYKEQSEELYVEWNYLKEFIKQQFDESALTLIIEQYFIYNPSAKIGDAMKYLKDNYAGQYDGKMASKIIKDTLANQPVGVCAGFMTT